MKIYTPDYYKNFSCVASACRHTCCQGWEIDLDAETYQRYMLIEGKLGEKLKQNVFLDKEGAHFCLDADERCPFLNKENLCEIILELGENALCGICTDHPRFRNFFENRTEIGLGIACESACSLILNRKTRPNIICDGLPIEPLPEEADFFQFREELFDIVFADLTVLDCIKEIADRFSILLPSPYRCTDFYANLEVLYDSWMDRLETAAKRQETKCSIDMPAKQLLAYFFYRHLPDCFYEDRLKEGIAFCLHATEMILYLSESDAEFEDTARAYSEEIEYSAENMGAIFAFLKNIKEWT